LLVATVRPGPPYEGFSFRKLFFTLTIPQRETAQRSYKYY